MKSRAIVAGVVVLGGLLAIGAGLTYWKYRAIKAAGNQPSFEPMDTVQVVEARTVKWQPTASLSGTVIALQSVTLSNEVAGTIKEVKFESGSVVEAGQVLVTLDDSTEQADLKAAEASVRVSGGQIHVIEANIRLAEANVKRMTEATEARAMSAADLDQSKATLDAARANLERTQAEVDQAKARVDQTKSQIAKKTLRAPFKATTGLRNIHPGQYLAEGASIVGLQSIADQIYLDFALPQEQAGRARKGLVVMAEAPMLGKEPLRIEVVALDAVADPSTRNVRIRAVVPNKEGKLRPGMFIDIQVPVEEPRDFIVVPTTAIRRASFGDHVFMIVPDEKDKQKMRARQRLVKLGPSIGSDVTVLEGLKEGEQLAAVGSFKLHEGGLVMKGEASPPSGRHPTETASTKK